MKKLLLIIFTFFVLICLVPVSYGATYYSGIKFSNTASDGYIATWEAAGQQWEWTAVAPFLVDTDFNNETSGILVKTSAGVYGIGTTFDLGMGGDYFVLMGEDGNAPWNAEQVAPEIALARMEAKRGDVTPITAYDPCIGGDADCTNDGTDGWASTTTIAAWYTKAGQVVHYYVYIGGTGKASADDPKIRLPYAVSSSSNYYVRQTCLTIDDGTNYIGMFEADGGNSTAAVRVELVLDQWSISAQRNIVCEIEYLTDS